VLQAVERESGTINYSAWEQHDIGDACRSRVSQGPQPCIEGCATTWVSWKVTIGVTVHDGMLNLRPNGAGGRHVRCDLCARFGKICHQKSTNGPKLGGMVEFKFKRHYKTQRAGQRTTLGHLRIERLSRALNIESRAIIEPLSSRVIEYNLDTMIATTDGLGIEEVTTGGAA